MLKLSFCLVLSVSAALSAYAAVRTGVARPELVMRVAKGELKAAKASWWGFDPADSTPYLQAAIDSKVPVLTVDRQTGPWIVRPLNGVSDQRIEFEKGVEIVARKGAFLGLNDCLLRYAAASNVVLHGEGAVLRMWRDDYRAAPYRKGEWRHALSLLSCSNVTVEGLTLAESGGDGIYVGVCRKDAPCRKIAIRDCLCDRNYRQGISVISADGLQIERTTMRDTAGTPPAAGIDFEPNHPSELLRDCVMRDCVCEGNAGCSAELYLGQLNRTSEPVSVRLENCRLSGAGRAGFSLANRASVTGIGFPRGEVTLERCVVENSTGAGIAVRDNPLGAVRLNFRACRLEGNCRRQTDGPDVTFPVRGIGGVVTDGLRFDDVTVVQPVSRPWISQVDTTWFERPISAIGGTVCVKDPKGTRMLTLDEAWRRETFGGAKDAARPVWRPFDPATCAVEDPQPGARTALAPLRPRGTARYVLFVDRPRAVRFKGRAFEYAKGVKGKYRVTLLKTGREIAAGTTPGSAGGALEFAVPAAGFCALDVDMGQRNAFMLTEGDVPTALELPRDGQHFIAGGGEVGFVVSGNAPFSVVACGSDGAEFASVSVADPSGRETWRNDRVDDPSGWVSGENAKAGTWSLRIGRPSSGCFEDHYIALRGTMPHLFVSPGRGWR